MQTKTMRVYRYGKAVVWAMAVSWVSVAAPADGAVKTLETAAVVESVRRTEVSIRGEMFFLNGRPTYEGREYNGMKIEGLLMNSRKVQGIFDDLNPQTVGAWAYPDTGEWDAERNTREFVAAMPSWREYGMLSFTINLQGGFPGEGYPGARQLWHNSALRSDGSLRDDYMNRLERILDRADELGMVPILGLYYFGQDERIEDEAAVIRGVQNTVNWVLAKGYRNVLLEINNECNVRYDHAILQPARVHELIELAKGITRDGRRLYVSTSYGGNTIPRENVVRASDYLLLHGNGVDDPKRIAEMVRQTRRVPGYRPVPILFNEDDHYDFEKPINNYLAAVGEYASWGYFDYRRRGEPFEAGYQAVPADWAISHPRKQGFFELTRRITGVTAHDANRIRPYAGNPYYWQYKGKPVLLLGGSWQDNLFNHTIGLERHLDLLQAVGGNYVRNVMSHRNEGNVFAYRRVDGKFDLDQWNDEYWRRFEDFLRLTHARDIIVQIEVFDRHDLSTDHQTHGGWSKHPFNPANNRNYSPEESRLPTAIPSTPGRGHPFFIVVPTLQNNELVLRYQRAYVDKLLSLALAYPHVLYCVQNESSQELDFGDFWAEHIHRRAREAGRPAFVTDMRNNWDLSHPEHHHIYDNPQRFNFLDVSQNSWQSGQLHYDRLLHVRRYIAARPRPINTTKIYNREGAEESIARLFRIVFAGGAGARFHRPHPLEGTDAHEKTSEYGLGLSPRAQVTLRSARLLSDAMNVFVCAPRNDLLAEREANEAYCLAEPGRQYAVYFPDGGAVKLDVSEARGNLQVRWLDISRSAWHEPQTVPAGRTLELTAPGKGHWAALVLAERQTAVSIDGDRFLINGRPTYAGLEPRALGRLMNVRMVNSTFDDENPVTRPQGLGPEANTTQFIATMDEYKAHGILAFTLNLQGGYPGYEGAVNSAFERDGSLKGPYMRRVARAIEAADARDMVVILGLFYQRQDQVLADEDALRAATRNAATWIAQNGYTNVLIEIANEYRHGGFDHRILKTEAGQVELMNLVRSVHPKLPVSTSGMGNAQFHPALCEAADFILLHGNETAPEDYAQRIAAVVKYGKPVVFNEDWCFSDDRRGVADAPAKATAAFENGASWGIMNQIRNQHWPFAFGIGQPDEGQNAREDRAAYETIRRLLGMS